MEIGMVHLYKTGVTPMEATTAGLTRPTFMLIRHIWCPGC